MKLLDLPHDLRDRRLFGFFDDFEWYLSPHRWTSLTADAGVSVSAGASAVGGAVVLATAAVDNSECAVATTARPFRPADDKPLFFEVRLQFSEAAVNAATSPGGAFSAAVAGAVSAHAPPVVQTMGSPLAIASPRTIP